MTSPLYVQIGSVQYEVLVEGAERSQSTAIGVRKRSFNGTMRSSERADKREWKCSLMFMTLTDLQTLAATVARSQIVSVTSPLFGISALSCMVTITSSPLQPKDDTDFECGCNISITEV